MAKLFIICRALLIIESDSSILLFLGIESDSVL